MIKKATFIAGFIMLLPGACGILFLIRSFLPLANSRSIASSELLMTLYASPAIQMGCLGLWLIAHRSTNIRLRHVTRTAGFFGALVTLLLAARFIQMFLQSNFYFNPGWQVAMVLYATITLLPFILGGLPAMLLTPKLDKPQ